MDPTYRTLSFVKNLGKVRVPCAETQNNEEYKKLYEKLLSHTESKEKVGSSGNKR